MLQKQSNTMLMGFLYQLINRRVLIDKPTSDISIFVDTAVAQEGPPTAYLLTSSSCHPKFLVKEFSYFLMPCHQHGLGVNLLVQR